MGFLPTMERYHILKLGLAITFYAAYCIRPMLVNSLEADNKLDSPTGLDYFQYFQGVEGKPGVDFPVYSYIPRTAFNCRGIESGYYADLDTDCQVFHICEDGRKISFLCPNGTIFQQSELICEWWNKVNCTNSPNLYEESAEKLQNDVARRKANRRVVSLNGAENEVRPSKTTKTSSSRHQHQQRINNHRIPDNNDIEQQIEQAESNNRHLANAKNSITQRYLDHNYDSRTTPKSRQNKKDIDKNTGNYINNNYDQSAPRQSKKVEQGVRNEFNYGTKTGQQKSSNGFKEYYAGIDTTTEKTKNYFYTTQPTDNNFITSTTAASTGRTTTTPAYGISLKNRYNSFDARPSTKQYNSVKTAQNNYRGSVKYNTPIPVTTYSPPRGNENVDNNFDLPPFPKHASELSEQKTPGQIKVNVIRDQERFKPGEIQVPQESSSFVKNSFNSITDDSLKTSASPYPNHRSTYSDIKDLSYLEAPKISSISSITPHLVTTQPINNGKPFVGSRVGSTILPNQPTTQSKYTYLPTSTVSSKPTIILGVLRHSPTNEPVPFGPPELSKNITDLFNVGETDKTLPPVETTSPVTNPIPTEIFNIGNTDTSLQTNIELSTTAISPLKIYVPEEGSLNIGQTEPPLNNDYQGLDPVSEPPFIKKTVPLLYSDRDSTQRTIDYATIYGTYPSSTFASTRNTPYSPTVPTVTASTTPRTSKALNQAVPIRFDKNQDKISIHLSKNVGGQISQTPKYGSAIQPPLLRVGAVVHVGDVQPLGDSSSTIAPSSQPNGFFITKGLYDGFSTKPPRSKTQKPRPFSKSIEERFNTGNTDDYVTSTFPTYHISSARPFEATGTTEPTPTTTTQPSPTFSVYDNVDNMIGVLQEIANFNSQKEYSQASRPGLVIPPSVGPQTLHSLAQYFANELENNETRPLDPETKEKLTGLLTAMTVHGYNNLFNVGSTATPTAPTTSIGLETTTVSAPSRFGSDAEDHDGDLSTTSLPELRELARNFSLALSSYLNDPETFRKSLETFRPTEPPPIDAIDNVESSTSEDELLNFSDADIKPSTPALPSATWGYILATNKDTEDDVKNTLNPDLNTADSQSFVPRFNNVQVDDEKQGKGFTDLPPNHWTTSPRATELWQKALSVNPAIVNDHFDTTPASFVSTDEETTEPELFNQEVLPDETLPQSQVTYDLRELPPISLNSTQVRGILIDFMNHTKSDGSNRLSRLLRNFNTSQDEFLERMKEIESNPLTKRLILLLISECGANITQDLEVASRNNPGSSESLATAASISSQAQARNVENHPFGQLVHPHLNEEDQDSRALQLLNSLYSIASNFGKKR